MSKYTKTKSKYVKRTFHQNANGSTITERDWLTIGSRNNFGKGKAIAYANGNFVFTRNNVKNQQKRNNLGTVTDSFDYDNVKDATNDSNKIKVNATSNDIRDFAYYGSCVELVRASIENIIKEFPGCIFTTNQELSLPPETGDGDWGSSEGYVISNQFNIDLDHDGLLESEVDNVLRYMSLSWDSYTINGKPIESYKIKYANDLDECSYDNEWDVRRKPVVTVEITSNVTYQLSGYQINGDIVFTTPTKNLVIKPKQEIINDYFNNLDGFEKQLLNLNSKPLYKNTFITPIEGELTYKYVNRDYIWPSNNGYCIDIETPVYSSFISQLYTLAQTMDELWADNLYRNMTHESIKNFDWTYTRSYADGEELDNKNGGERMKKILAIMGRVFDDVKRNIDGIKATNTVTYSSCNNTPDALLTDELELMGWDVKSTIPTFDDSDKNMGEVTLDDEWLENNAIKWFWSTSPYKLTMTKSDVNFMRRLALSSQRILTSKGTLHSLDMVMALFGLGDKDYKVEQLYYDIKPTKYKYEVSNDNIVEINQSKSLPLNYFEEDDYSGIPLKDVIFSDSQHYIVPYFENGKEYDGDLYFQSKGGWGKGVKNNHDITSDNSGFDYIETISYLHVVSTINELLNVNPNDVKKGDMYYVANISDYVDYYEMTYGTDQPVDFNKLTHFFQVTNEYNTDWFSSWENLDSETEQVKYIESIITTTLGNNPHVGYGNYDIGQTFINTMLKPFKYALDNNKFEDSEIADRAEKITWNIDDTTECKKIENKDKIVVFGKEDGQVDDLEHYFINSKILVLKNEHVGKKYYNEYFKKVILHYLMQVIPSTTLLVLKGFE